MAWYDELFGSRGSASLGPNSVSDMGSLSVDGLRALTPGSALPSYTTEGLTTNGVNFDRATQNAAVPGIGAGLGSGLGLNIGTGQLAMTGLNGLAQLWTGMQSAKLAREQFDFTKKNTEMNTANQIRSYNSALEDRYRTRGIAEGRQSEMDDLLARNRMTR